MPNSAARRQDDVWALVLLGHPPGTEHSGVLAGTVIASPPPGVAAGDHLLGSPGLLAGVVASLLAQLVPGGADQTVRVPV